VPVDMLDYARTGAKYFRSLAPRLVDMLDVR
jgi:hypothetical protein